MMVVAIGRGMSVFRRVGAIKVGRGDCGLRLGWGRRSKFFPQMHGLGMGEGNIGGGIFSVGDMHEEFLRAEGGHRTRCGPDIGAVGAQQASFDIVAEVGGENFSCGRAGGAGRP